jgi:Uma2 family endonuclease
MTEAFLLDDESSADDRVRFKASDVRRMLEAGILDDERRYEVIEGEIIEIQAHNPPHLRVKRWLLRSLYRQLDDACWIDSEPTFSLQPNGDFTLPDLIVYPAGVEAHLVRGPDTLLVIEVADKTLKKDRGRKAQLYARHGVRDYWVVNALSLATHRYLAPAGGRYSTETEHAPDETLTPILLPGVQLRLADVG